MQQIQNFFPFTIKQGIQPSKRKGKGICPITQKCNYNFSLQSLHRGNLTFSIFVSNYFRIFIENNTP